MTSPSERLDQANQNVSEYLRATRFSLAGLDPETGLSVLPNHEHVLAPDDAVDVISFEGQILSDSEKLALAYSLGVTVGAAMERTDTVPPQIENNVRRVVEG